MVGKKLIIGMVVASVLAFPSYAFGTIGKPWHPKILKDCQLVGKREFRQYRIALITRDRALLREACDKSPWTVR